MAWHELADVGTMLALSIRQPYAELILRGIKTVEYRTRATRIIDEEFYIYAARSRAKTPGINRGMDRVTDCVGTDRGRELVRSDNLITESPPPWMLELAEQVRMIEPATLLPMGLLVGKASIKCCVQRRGHFEWHLNEVTRLDSPRKPARPPQPMWFRPF